ncbi:MAG: toll/interleukin-1 receptor domain-containing protein, partial [Candidatus Eisenbacteria bacterium]|nr:toll/interleukin-1 receptor domain-containing protein [Candidatus Eisenbacteria bacterium]
IMKESNSEKIKHNALVLGLDALAQGLSKLRDRSDKEIRPHLQEERPGISNEFLVERAHHGDADRSLLVQIGGLDKELKQIVHKLELVLERSIDDNNVARIRRKLRPNDFNSRAGRARSRYRDFLTNSNRIQDEIGDLLRRLPGFWQKGTETIEEQQNDGQRFDIFISHSHKDHGAANDIVKAFERVGLRCFLAEKDICAGKLWKDEIRDALAGSSVVVLLLTPNSISSNWVMCESGACWALRKPLAPALIHVDIGDVPEVINAFQCKRFETAADRESFVDQVRRMCQELGMKFDNQLHQDRRDRLPVEEMVEIGGVLWKHTPSGLLSSKPRCPNCVDHPVLGQFPPRSKDHWVCSACSGVFDYVEPPNEPLAGERLQ